MAIVVEDGTGKTDAETYVSEAAADTYHTNHGDTTWALLTTAAKEAALRNATQYLDGTYVLRWKGQSNTSTQALDWPRTGVIRRDGWLIDSDVIPQALKDACAVLALEASAEDLIPTIDDPGSITFYAVKVGPIEEKTSYSSRSQVVSYRKATVLINDLIERGDTITIGER